MQHSSHMRSSRQCCACQAKPTADHQHGCWLPTMLLVLPQVLEGLLAEDDSVPDVWYLAALCAHAGGDFEAALEAVAAGEHLLRAQGRDIGRRTSPKGAPAAAGEAGEDALATDFAELRVRALLETPRSAKQAPESKRNLCASAAALRDLILSVRFLMPSRPLNASNHTDLTPVVFSRCGNRPSG